MRYVVLGASAAGINGALTLRRLDSDSEIILVSEDEKVYSRCILHHYMEGIRTVERLNFTDTDWDKKYRITWKKGIRATEISAGKKCVRLSDGEELIFDKLLIATGAHSYIPTIPGIKNAGRVLGFRNLEDCERLMELAPESEHIVVMGAGLVGMDVVTGLLTFGKEISVIDMQDHMLPVQLDEKAAETYQKAYGERGVKQYYRIGVKQVVSGPEGMVKELVLSDERTIPCDLLVMTAGVRANVEFLEGSGVKTDRYGLIIDTCGKTNADGIYGAGDVTGRSPIWPAAVKQGIVAACNMAGQERKMTDFFASKSTMNFLEIPTMSLGIHDALDDSYEVEVMEDEKGNYRKIIHKDGKIYGALLQGDLSYSGVLTQLIRFKIDVSKVKKSLFAIDYSDFFHVQDNFEFRYEEGESL